MSVTTEARPEPTTFAEAEVTLAESLPGYESRAQQQTLARAVEGALATRSGALLAEAGCGTGKSLGYLIPSILSGKRVIVSTATKALQDQIACVAPETKILTADLRHVPAGEVYVGQELVGFDEQPERGDNLGLRRRYRRSTVESVRRITKPCYEIEFDDGTTIVCSTDHQWLTKQSMNVKWMTTDRLCPTSGKRLGSCVIRLSDVWNTDTSWESGYLAGVYDGEGCLGQRRSLSAGGHYNSLTFSQRDNECYKRAAGILDDQLIDWRNHRREHEGHDEWDPINIIHISKRTDIMRVLGQFRPERLLAKFDPEMLGTIPTIRQGRSHGQRVVRKTLLGDREVVVIQTSTKTFIAEGLASHNCKDLPFLAENLGVDFTYALLKGRSNYLCQSKVNDPEVQANVPMSGVLATLGKEVANPDFMAEKDDFVIQDQDWRKLVSSGDECPGKSQCPFGEVCFAEKAKAKAKASDVVVVNHALFLTDLKIKGESGQGAMLDEYDAVVFDEAHEIEEYAGSVFGSNFSEAGIRNMASEARNFAKNYLDGEVADEVTNDAEEVLTALTGLWMVLKPGVIRQADLFEAADAFIDFTNALGALSARLLTPKLLEMVAPADFDKARNKRNRLANKIANLYDRFKIIVTGTFEDHVRWVEDEKMTRGDTRRVLKVAPVSVAPILREILFEKPHDPVTTVLASATMSVGGKFDYLAGRLGIDTYQGIDVGTPFDYTAQAGLYIPKHLPDPGKEREAWSSMAIFEMGELIKASNGRALLLFTSYKAMKDAYEMLAPRLPYLCLKQGDASNKVLAEQFMADKHSVLFGTRSFMTGFDVVGESLSLVVVDKLPFPVPTEPLTEARCNLIKAEGGSDFSAYTVPVMTLILKQAFGRLIRHRDDRGVVAILDPRLLTKGYGKGILNSLPPAQRMTSIEQVQSFFKALEVERASQ